MTVTHPSPAGEHDSASSTTSHLQSVLVLFTLRLYEVERSLPCDQHHPSEREVVPLQERLWLTSQL